MHSGPHGLHVRLHRLLVEFNDFGKIDLRNYRDIRAIEDRGILQWLVLTLRHREQNQPKILSQIVGRRADQIPHILNKEEVQLVRRKPRRLRQIKEKPGPGNVSPPDRGLIFIKTRH